MPTLRDLQADFARALTGEGEMPDCIRADGIAVDERFSVYRSTYLGALTNGLRLTYPAVLRLVGEEFFDGAAYYFIQQWPPAGASLNDYGAEFASFLEGFEPAAALAYLPDMARLEWAVNIALHAPDERALPRDGIPADDIKLVPSGSLSLLQSDFPVEAIWRGTLGRDDDALSAVNLSDGADFLVVAREGLDVRVTPLSRAAFEATQLLCIGTPLDQVLPLLTEEEGVALLAQHLATGRFTLYNQETTS